MTYAELRERAVAHLEMFPDESGVDIYINGFLAGFREAGGGQGTDTQKETERFDMKSIVARFNATCTAFSTVKVLSAGRRDKLRVRLTEMKAYGNPEEVAQTVFDKMQASDFLRGENARKWKASFDWLLSNDRNWAKVYEGQYDNRGTASHDIKDVNDYWG